ncbi:hypothetical protein J6590_066444 [Homalodisca vitripennis]|nr:hypothetical protein J6590_066444 [Homalodisca vitripennis]
MRRQKIMCETWQTRVLETTGRPRGSSALFDGITETDLIESQTLTRRVLGPIRSSFELRYSERSNKRKIRSYITRLSVADADPQRCLLNPWAEPKRSNKRKIRSYTKRLSVADADPPRCLLAIKQTKDSFLHYTVIPRRLSADVGLTLLPSSKSQKHLRLAVAIHYIPVPISRRVSRPCVLSSWRRWPLRVGTTADALSRTCPLTGTHVRIDGTPKGNAFRHCPIWLGLDRLGMTFPIHARFDLLPTPRVIARAIDAAGDSLNRVNVITLEPARQWAPILNSWITLCKIVSGESPSTKFTLIRVNMITLEPARQWAPILNSLN